MDLRLLKYFIAVYEERNVTKAAARCFVSQPSLSNAIRQLEEDLGTRLFERSPKGMSITDDAAHLYPRALRLVKESQELNVMFKEKDEIASIEIGTFPDLSPKKMKEFLQVLKVQLPSLSLRFVDHDCLSDARITLDAFKREEELFIPLWEEKYVLCVHRKHYFAERTVVRPEDLHDEDFIECPPCEVHHQTIGLLADSMHKMNIVAKADNKLQIMHLVESGFGISFLPTGVLEFAHEIVSVPFDGPSMVRKVGLCCPASESRTSVMDDVLNLIFTKYTVRIDSF